MNDNLLKTGTFSIVLGKNHYEQFIPPQKNKLLKICRIVELHQEGRYLNTIKTIKDYRKYYAIPEEVSFLLRTTDPFYEHLWYNYYEGNETIFKGNLTCFYIESAGNQELLDCISDIADNKKHIWHSYSVILNFVKQIMKSINYLHEKKLCHLDIKPENIIVNTFTFRFKLVDFGFCSQEPFDDYVINISGTPGYFPKRFSSKQVKDYSPQIKANDFVLHNGFLPLDKNRKLVYKIDSFCLGRVIYIIKFMYDKYKKNGCWNREKKNGKKLYKIMSSLLKKNVYTRYTIQQCLDIYF